MAKSDLQARPVYHRKRDSIEAHLTIVLAALAVSRWIESTTGWIVQLGVAPEARGRDLGVSMIAEVVSQMRAAGETTITLNVGTDNPHAARLYNRAGFTRTGRRAKYA